MYVFSYLPRKQTQKVKYCYLFSINLRALCFFNLLDKPTRRVAILVGAKMLQRE